MGNPLLDLVRRRLREEEKKVLAEQSMTELPYEKLRYESILEGLRRARKICREYPS